jgi:EpsG family
MIYLLFFIVIIFVTRLLEPGISRRVLCLVIALMLSVFAALRGPEVANDYVVYRDWYSGVGLESSRMERTFIFELFFYELMKFCSKLGMPFPLFLGVVAFPSVYIKLIVLQKFSKTSNAFICSVALYCVTFYLLNEFTQIRAGIAISIVMFATYQLLTGKLMKFYLLLLVASGFHLEALLAVPFPLLIMKRSREVNYLFIGVTLALVSLRLMGQSLLHPIASLISTWDPKLELYISIAFSDNAVRANPFSIPAVLLFLISVNIIFSDAVSSQDVGSDAKILVFLARCILVSLWPLFIIPEIHEISLRSYEFIAVNILLVAAMVFSRKRLFIAKTLLLGWGGALAFIHIFRADSLVRPYSFFWS